MSVGVAGNRVFWQTRVYKFIAARGPVSRRDVAIAFRAGDNAVSQVLGRMCRRGAIVKIGGYTKGAQYVIAGARPEDMRGTSIGSLQALDAHAFTPDNRNRGRGVSKTDARPPAIPSLADLLAR